MIYAGGDDCLIRQHCPLLKVRSRQSEPAFPGGHAPGAWRPRRAIYFLCLQMLGMHGTVYANYAVNEAEDLLLALGVRFDDRVTGKVSEFAKHGQIVRISSMISMRPS